MNIKIGDTIIINNPFSNVDEENELVSINEHGDYILKNGHTTRILTQEYLKLKRFIIKTKKVKYMNFTFLVLIINLFNFKY